MEKKRPDISTLRLTEDAWAEIRNALTRHNRNIPFGDLRGRLSQLKPVIEAIIMLPREPLEVLNKHSSHDSLEMILCELIARLPPPAPSPFVDVDLEELPAEDGVGEGMGERVTYEEGLRRLREYSVDVDLETIAGPLGDAAEIERKLGIPLPLLAQWHEQKQVVALKGKEECSFYPLAQFVDGKPIDGIKEVLEFIPHPRTAWMWLIRLKPSIGGMPLELLRQRKLYDVLAAAERDFG
ncbi:antitoxin Xre/MbcA/ParS-like domain-containing protein [Aquamicrobium zhengzhouense]|uniref:Antitoxin Xre/MbcA/ParS-like middle domain-containing protein n=1 Tax=Aquamicrobium zhengzhouense TaxID=2781738 RepID=A0ABS0SHE5_9HYPH|nr:hypothetical protein [Aquamicrobium zhengzhouense]MBI1622730.1 hypothetical protein [Aquamicrobium zhengzhouense]